MKFRNPFLTEKRAAQERSQVLREQGLYIEDGVLKVGNVASTIANVYVTPETGLEIPAVVKALKEITETFAALDYKVMRGEKDQEKHPLANAINTRPNDSMSGYTLKKTMMSNLVIYGEAFAEVVDKPTIDGIYNIYPRMNKDTKRITKDAAGNAVDYYEVKENGRTRRVEPADMIHVIGMSFDGLRGVSPINLCKSTVALYVASTRFGTNFFANGGRPSGVMSIKTEDNEPVSNVQRRQIKQEWNEENDGGLAVISNADYVPVSTAPGDAQFIETKNFLIQEVSRMLSIPLSKVSDVSSRTYNNVEQEAVEFIIETLLPLVKSFESELDRKFFEDLNGDFKGTFDYAELLSGTTEERYGAYNMALGGQAWMLPNEVREKENLEQLPQFDVIIEETPEEEEETPADNEEEEEQVDEEENEE